MKGSLAALTLATTTMNLGIADDCCCPPKPCIDCECYSPPTYDLECAWGGYIAVDFLYWFAKETGLTYAIENQTVIGVRNTPAQGTLFLASPVKYFEMEESWDPGFRVGIGYTSECEGWDLRGTWTYFHTKEKSKTTVDFPLEIGVPFPANKSLSSPWTFVGFTLRPPTSEISSDTQFFNRIEAEWKLDLNLLDLEVGRSYWLSRCISMRPYFGVRGGWTKTDFFTQPSNSVSEEGSIFTTSLDSLDHLKFNNRFWGWGFVGGMQPRWHFGCGFSLFGTLDAALLWGKYTIKRKEKSSFSLLVETTSDVLTTLDVDFANAKNSFTGMQAILDLGAGLSWDQNFCCDRYRFGLDLGWEHHIWFDHNHRHQIRGSFEDIDSNFNTFVSYGNVDETYGNLVFAGLTVRARFEF